MEKIPQEPTLDEQVNLAKVLSNAVDARNSFINPYPDMDDLSVFLNGSPDMRTQYESLEKAVIDARAELDAQVSDKKALVDHLHGTGLSDLADRISRMFSVT